MAEFSVHEWMEGGQSPTGMDWEEGSYREGCAYARELALRRLKAIDDEFMRSRSEGMRLVGFRQRTLVTEFGDVLVRHRMCRVSELPESRQDEFARFLLAELDSEWRWDELLSLPESDDLLDRLADDALDSHKAGRMRS